MVTVMARIPHRVFQNALHDGDAVFFDKVGVGLGKVCHKF